MIAPQRPDSLETPPQTVAYEASSAEKLAIGPAIDRIQAILDIERDKYAGSLAQASPDMTSFIEPFVARLFQSISGTVLSQLSTEEDSLEGSIRAAIVDAGRHLYYEVGRTTLGPLVVRFAEHVLKHVPARSTVAFLARDAESYFSAASIIRESAEISTKRLSLRYVTLNRHHLGIVDENLKRHLGDGYDSEQEILKGAYLEQEGFANPHGVAIVDTGCWGTLIEKLWKAAAANGRAKLNLQHAYFMYSHNPNIYGFVNHKAAEAQRMDLAREGVFIGDTFECLPKNQESARRFMRGEDGIIVPVPQMIDSVYLEAWQQAVLEGITSAATEFIASPSSFPTAVEAISIMEERRLAAANEFTGVLPQSTPKWTHGETFLSEWSLPQIPPLGYHSVD